MFCPNCGAQNPDGTPKCTTCGQVLQSAGARPQAKFKGTMLMTNDAAPPARGQGAPPPGAKGQFAKTMMGGMASLDPALMGGGGMIAGPDENSTMFAGPGGPGNQVEAARTIAMDAASFGLGGPQAAGPVASPFAPHAPARPTAPAAPEPAMSTNEEDLGVASTIAVDASSFGFDAQNFPGPGPGSSSFGQSAPQAQAPQPQAPQAQPQPQQPMIHQQPASSSTVAMDASAFGLGGPGAPGMPGGFGQQQPPQGGGFGQQQQPPQGGGFGQQQQPPQGGGFGQPQPGGPQGPGPGGPGGFGAPMHNESSGISSTVAVDASAFGLGGMGGPGMPGMPGQYGQQPGMQPQGQYGQQPGMPPQGQYGMLPGMPPQGQYGMQPQGQYGMQPGMQPQGQYGVQPAPAKGGKAGLVIVLVVLLLLVVGGSFVAFLHR